MTRVVGLARGGNGVLSDEVCVVVTDSALWPGRTPMTSSERPHQRRVGDERKTSGSIHRLSLPALGMGTGHRLLSRRRRETLSCEMDDMQVSRDVLNRGHQNTCDWTVVASAVGHLVRSGTLLTHVTRRRSDGDLRWRLTARSDP